MADISSPVVFSFQCSAFDKETFQVIGFTGTEEISRPYRFEIDLLADNPDLDMEQLLYSTATLSLEKGDSERRIHGVLTECRLSDALPDNRFCYHVVLVPRLWLLCLSRQNQIYQNKSVPEIVKMEITADTAKGATKSASAGLTSDDFEPRLTREKYYQKESREYTVQYKESDLNFISRLMEHEGIFYFFEQGDDREKTIISDNNIHFAALAGDDKLPYRPGSGLSRSEDEAILAFSGRTRRIPCKMILKDYNYESPDVTLMGKADIDDKAHGVVCEYGDHFKSTSAGDTLAGIRAQEIYCTKQTFQGRSDSVRFSAGWRFTLDEHFRDAFNMGYVLTKVIHEGRQPLEATAGLSEEGQDAAHYGNDFTCIPADVDFRPARQTPKPVFPGLMNAHVDAAQMEQRAEIDGQGRYKLVMPFDLSEAEAGKASRFVRKAQPYGGHDMGMHFPLLKDTEVICDFVNGDPDRPIIVGVVPNPEKKSVVTVDNYTRNVIKTPSGVVFEINDGTPPKG